MKLKLNQLTTLVLCLLVSSPVLAERSGWSFGIGGGAGQRSIQTGPDFTPFLLTIGSTAPTTTEQQNLLNLAQIEGLQGQEIETREGHYRIMIEKQFGEGQNFSLNFGLSGVSATEKCISSCGDLTRAYLLNSLSSSSTNIFTFQLLGSALLGPSEFDYTYYTLDFGLNWHFMPKETIDPYFGIELGLGVCSVPGAASCTAARGMGKLGVRFYATENFYLFLQGEYQSVTFTATFEDGSGVYIEPDNNQVLMFGLGYAI